MPIWELFVISAGLAMDAFAVSICKGLSLQKMNIRSAFIVGTYFGSFQALMPLLGYITGRHFSCAIAVYDHWIAFILLGIIGGNMIREALNQEEESCSSSVAAGDMIILAIATSIDALAVGVTFAFFPVHILTAIALIGITTFVLSFIGVKVGVLFGSRYKSKAEFFGGAALIFMGIKILIEHLSFRVYSFLK